LTILVLYSTTIFSLAVKFRELRVSLRTFALGVTFSPRERLN
jgi:hypothetical protein